MSAKEKQGFSLYFLIAFGLAWLCQVGGCMALLQQKNAVLYQLALIATMFCPLLAVLLVQKVFLRQPVGIGWKVQGKRRFWLVLSLLLNLAILFFFKYYNFASNVVTRALSFAGLQMDIPFLDVLLPVGISFYTFQALGYTIDVYRKDIEAEKSFIDYALFVSFFPQLVAGPIERSGNILHQLKEYPPFRFDNIKEGILPALWGLFKKVLAVIVNQVYNSPKEHTGAEFLVATAAFAFQIYCDFSAYSDIARGSAKMLGFDLMQNFNCPYFAVSIKDFWRRWHISLSSWFKDYLYFPLGGSRCSKWRHRLNIMIVFAVSGLWHGAALTFVAWGLLNGLYQVLSDLFQPARKKLLSLLHISDENKGYKVFRILVTFCLTCLAWVLFRANSLSDAMQIYGAIFRIPLSGIHGSLAAFGVSFPTLVLMLLCVLALLAADWFIHNRKLPQKLNNTLVLRYAVYFILIAVMLLFGSYGDGYDPQDFVYFQF